MTTTFDRRQYTARDFDSILSELEALAETIDPDLSAQFTGSELGSFLLDMGAFVGDRASFATDAAAVEVFLALCKRYDSALRFCRSVGYVPRTAEAARGPISTETYPAVLRDNGGTVPAGSIVKGAGDTVYEMITDVVLAPGHDVTSSQWYWYEGTSYSEEFETTAQPRQQIQTANAVVAGSLSYPGSHVFIGDSSDPANEWVEVDNVAAELSATETFELSYDGVGHLLVQFGDGTAGKIPDDRITVDYRTCHGADGNAAINTLFGTVSVAITGLGYNIELAVSNGYPSITGPITGGQDRESLSELKINVPAYIQTHGVTVGIRDYDTAPRQVAGVATCLADKWFSSYRGNALKQYIWGSEAVDFISESPAAGNRSTVTYTRYKQATAVVQQAVRDYLAERTDVGTFASIVCSDVAWVDIYMGAVTYDRGQDATAIHEAVTQAVVTLFEDSDGLSLRVSSIYDAVRTVPGVQYFEVLRLVYEHAMKARATGTVEFAANPADGDTIAINDGEQSVTFEFDDDSSVGESSIAVAIAGSSHDTMSNLVDVINTTLANVTAYKTTDATPTANLTQKYGGSNYNYTISKSGADITVTGMSGGSATVADVQIDMRRDVINPGGANDAWPPNGAYTPGLPFAETGEWADSGIEPYESFSDITVGVDRYSQRYYNEAYIYNNEIVYDANPEASVEPEALNLRRLVFELTPSAR